MSKEKIRIQITQLSPIVEELKKTTCSQEKITILNEIAWVKGALNANQFSTIFSSHDDLQHELVIKALIAINQASIVFNLTHQTEDKDERLTHVIKHLIEIENFYQQLGGIVGYHLAFLTLILDQEAQLPPRDIHYIPPKGINLKEDNSQIRHHIKMGIRHLNQTAVFLPIGGAGDRLNLIDEVNKQPLPAAILPFLGRTLLEGLIRDLQAQEYLFYKLYHQSIHIPIVLMTSREKDNHKHICEIITSHRRFGRPKENFHIFMQPLVPVITEEGNWSLSSCLTLSLKPGGHGVIWKLAKDKGVLKLLASQGYHRAFVRQINNPLASTDSALLALIGKGSQSHKSFGFLSCERALHSAEGANVLIEKKTDEGYSYCISNVEYTNFDRKGIGEVPLYEGSPFSMYPSNTNILYINIEAIQKSLEVCLFPGVLINMKTAVPYIDPEGHKTEIKGGRLESTMQNIADCMFDEFRHRLKREESHDRLQTFIIFSERIKTISTTKKSFKIGESPVSTPEQAYYDLQQNNLELFEKHCFFSTPRLIPFQTYITEGPNCIILFHPALGPLYCIIAQKIQRGRLAENAELQLEIAEVDIQDLDLDGSLRIESYDPLDVMHKESLPPYTHPCNCTLKNVKIRNRGINREMTQHYWKNQIIHHETVKIILNEGSEFHAQDLIIEGHQIFEVPAYHRLTLISNSKGEWAGTEIEKTASPSWYWNYWFDEADHLKLEKMHN